MAMKLSERDRRAVLLGAAGLGLLVAYLYGVEPGLDWYEHLRADHERASGQLAKQAYEAQERVFLAGQVARWEQGSGVIERPRPYSEEVTRLGARIVAAAQESGVELKGSSSTPPVPFMDDAALDMVTLLVDFNCQWEQFFKFVDAMYKTPGVLSVEQASINGDPKKGGKLDVKLTVSVLVKAGQRQGAGGATW